MKAPLHAREFRYAPLDNVDDWLACGWLATDGLCGLIPHAFFSCLVAWLCDCSPVMPVKE